jgi:hypothetical protein
MTLTLELAAFTVRKDAEAALLAERPEMLAALRQAFVRASIPWRLALTTTARRSQRRAHGGRGGGQDHRRHQGATMPRRLHAGTVAA